MYFNNTCMGSIDDISSLTWHPSSHFFASAGGADKHIRVWHNTAGIKAQIHDLEGQLKRAKTDSLKVGLGSFNTWTIKKFFIIHDTS